MYYLRNFLFIFSLRFGCRLIACLEVIVYVYGLYFVYMEFGVSKILISLIMISMFTSCILSMLLAVSTLPEHESSGIIFTYLMWGVFSTIFMCVFYIWIYVDETMVSVPIFLGLLLGTTVAKFYNMLVVLSFLHMIVSSDSEDSD